MLKDFILKAHLVLKIFKGPLSHMRHFLTTESPLKMMNNAFCFMLEALSILRYLDFCPDCWLCRKRLDEKAKVNFKIYDVTVWITYNYNTYIV